MTTPGPNGHRPSQPDAQQAMASAMADQINQATAEAQAKMAAQVQANIADLQELAAKGIKIDPIQMLNMRIDLIVQEVGKILGPQGMLWVTSCNLAFEQQLAVVIERAKVEGTKAVLGSGALLSPSQIRDLAKQTKTFGGS